MKHLLPLVIVAVVVFLVWRNMRGGRVSVGTGVSQTPQSTRLAERILARTGDSGAVAILEALERNGNAPPELVAALRREVPLVVAAAPAPPRAKPHRPVKHAETRREPPAAFDAGGGPAPREPIDALPHLAPLRKMRPLAKLEPLTALQPLRTSAAHSARSESWRS